MFEFKKKAQFISKDVSNGLQELWDKYKYAEEKNLDSVNEYYNNLLKRAENKEGICHIQHIPSFVYNIMAAIVPNMISGIL